MLYKNELTDLQKEHFNKLNDLENDLLNWIYDNITQLAESSGMPIPDRRWLSIGKTHIEQGFMAIRRAVTKPEC